MLSDFLENFDFHGIATPYFFATAATFLLSFLAYKITYRLIPSLSPLFTAAGLHGIDMAKRERIQIPESLGMVAGTVYLITLFVYIPFPFVDYFVFGSTKFAYCRFVDYLSALLSICCMMLLGFADDVLDLRWRHKIVLPLMASLPILMTYLVNGGFTVVIIPSFLRSIVGYSLDVGILYYIYMAMLAIFCTNAINILSGINGLEAGQSLVIACSIAVFNFLELLQGGLYFENHLFSLCLILPFIGVTAALFHYNKYPARVFVGDTFCYFAGMTLAVVAILGRFSKTLLLFFIPQIFNFVFSTPQLFHLVPCPRHRLPRYDAGQDISLPSTFRVKLAQLGFLPRLIIRVFSLFRLVDVTPLPGDDDGTVEVTNFTVVNLTLKLLGPMREDKLTKTILLVQIFCSAIGFTVRYPLANYFYPR